MQTSPRIWPPPLRGHQGDRPTHDDALDRASTAINRIRSISRSSDRLITSTGVANSLAHPHRNPDPSATRVDSEQTTSEYAHFNGARATSIRNAIGAQDGVSSTWLVAPASSAELLRYVVASLCDFPRNAFATPEMSTQLCARAALHRGSEAAYADLQPRDHWRGEL